MVALMDAAVARGRPELDKRDKTIGFSVLHLAWPRDEDIMDLHKIAFLAGLEAHVFLLVFFFFK